MRTNYGKSLNRSDESKEKLENTLEFVCKVELAIHCMLEGHSENFAAEKYGLDKRKLRRWILNINSNEDKLGMAGNRNLEEDAKFIFYTPGENLWVDVTGEKTYDCYSKIPYDIEKVWNYILPKVLTKRGIAVIREYYWEGHTLEECAKSHRVTRERIRQILAKSIIKLKDANRLRYKNYLYLGMSFKNKLDIAKKNSQIIQRKEELNKELLDILRTDDSVKRLAMIEACKKIDANFNHEDLIKEYKPPVTLKYILDSEVLSVRAYNCLYRGFNRKYESHWNPFTRQYEEDTNRKKLTLDSLIFEISPDDLMKCRNLGRKSYNEIVKVFEKYGWSEASFYEKED